MGTTDVQRLFDWLLDGAPGAANAPAVVQRLGPGLVEGGVPVERIVAFVRTLHPHIVGRSFVWSPDRPVEVRENSYAYLQSAAFLDSPVARVFRTGEGVRRRIADPECPRDFRLIDELEQDGFTDYFAGPLRFMNGTVHAITFATRAAGGFSEEQVAGIERILRPLSRVAEILALSRTAANLLDTYVGRNAGERILAGKIQRGDTDALRAVLWFSDLRGFTTMSAELEPAAIIRVLNELFDCQVPAIEKRGGEVLKFMGDGLLAIFPLEAEADAGERCEAALDAADEAFEALAALNARRAAAGGAKPIRFGLALHVGDIAYGNIGGSGRLDFTCIGPAVNLASRLEGLTGRLEEPLVMSAEFARRTGRKVRALGAFELKGVAEPAEVFAPER